MKVKGKKRRILEEKKKKKKKEKKGEKEEKGKKKKKKKKKGKKKKKNKKKKKKKSKLNPLKKFKNTTIIKTNIKAVIALEKFKSKISNPGLNPYEHGRLSNIRNDVYERIKQSLKKQTSDVKKEQTNLEKTKQGEKVKEKGKAKKKSYGYRLMTTIILFLLFN